LVILRLFARRWGSMRERSMRRRVLLVAWVVVLMMLTHMSEMGVWAIALYLTGAIDSFGVALNFAATTYTTVGYADALRGSWQLVSAILAMVGWIMFGWTTGMLVHVVGLFYRSMDLKLEGTSIGWE
jgi:glucose uptake protein GlcU